LIFLKGLDIKIEERRKREARIRKKNIATPDPHSHQEAHIEMIPNTPRKGIVDY
jgi:hypothetical protein